MTSHSATFVSLSDFIRNRMSMSHIYQPVMLMEILKSGGSASVTDIAKALLERDPSQVEYYERITKSMVGDVLTTKNGITEKIKVGIQLQAVGDIDTVIEVVGRIVAIGIGRQRIAIGHRPDEELA